MEAALLPQRGGGAPPRCVRVACDWVVALGGFAACESRGCVSENELKLGWNQGESRGVKDPKTPGGGDFQSFIEACGVPNLRMELVRAG